MPTHISARLSWHMDGWNGHICTKPGRNTFCIGAHSYPGDKIRTNRNLEWEESAKVVGKCCAQIDGIPPCIYSINAFGLKTLTAFDDPPDFFGSGTRTTWTLPPATVCIWPYEAMYEEEAKVDGRVSNEKRLELANKFFNAITPHESLVFHYANYSNPLSTDDVKCYVVVGLSRIKAIGNIEYYEGTDQETKDKYAGGFAWQRNIETHYPDQGLRIPYHRYLDRPEVLEKITLIPENVRCFKYASRHVSDDDALSLVERFVEIATYLRDEVHDDSENWTVRIEWLNSLLAELWKGRGLYPGMARVMELLGLATGISACRAANGRGEEKAFHDQVFAWLDNKAASIPNVTIDSDETTRVRRQWRLRTAEEQQILSELLPRLDLPKEQMEAILSEDRQENCLESTLTEICENPYLLAEQFVGNGPDDLISFSRIDHGAFPSPELGGEFIYDTDDWRRLRAMCVDRLRYETRAFPD